MKNIHKYLRWLLKSSLHTFMRLDFSLPTLIKTTYHNSLNAEADENPAASIKPDIKGICKSVKQCHFQPY